MLLRTSWDYWGALHVKALRLEAVALVLALTTCGLVGLTAWLVTRPVPIYYIPAASGPGLLQPGEVPEVLVLEFAQQLVLLLYNITPQTVTAAHREVGKYLHPQLLISFQAQTEREHALITEQQLSAQLSIRAAVAQTTPPYRQVSLQALRRVYVGTLPVRDEEVQATVTLLPVRPSALNPYGLVVTGLQISPLSLPEGASRRGTRSP